MTPQIQQIHFSVGTFSTLNKYLMSIANIPSVLSLVIYAIQTKIKFYFIIFTQQCIHQYHFQGTHDTRGDSLQRIVLYKM